MYLAQGPKHSDAGEAQTHGPLVSSQALYHWATSLPPKRHKKAELKRYNILLEAREESCQVLQSKSKDG